MRPLATTIFAASAMLVSCKSCDDPPKVTVDAAALPSATTPPAREASAPPPAVDAGGPRDAAAAWIDEPFGEAGTSSCRLTYGPAEQPFRGPAALAIAGQDLRLITNESGKPSVNTIAIVPLPKGLPSIVPARPTSFVGVRWPPCEIAGRFVYCQGPGGGITRQVLAANGKFSDAKTVVSKSRAGARIAAAAIGEKEKEKAEHSVVAFLDVRHTTEGDMLQAFIALDDKEPVRLSDDGAGATTLRFLDRGDSPIATYLDTRTAMVPIHARPVSLRGGANELALGTDRVLHVGGAPERGIDFAVGAATPTKGFVFIPMPRDTMDFGMLVIPLDDPPKEDVPATWSKYPNGLDPAPIGVASARDGKGIWVVRARPREKAVGSPRILELGRLDQAGVFTSHGEIVGLGKGVTDISVIEDNVGGVWILYGDTTITWLERRVCG